MTRARALAWLKAEFADPVAELAWSFESAVDEGRLAGVLDNALRDLGVQEDGLADADVPQDQAADLLAYLTYHALRAITRAFALWVDVEVDDPRTAKNYSQRYRAYQKLLDQAKDDVAALRKSSYESGALTLDIYEPTPY